MKNGLLKFLILAGLVISFFMLTRYDRETPRNTFLQHCAETNETVTTCECLYDTVMVDYPALLQEVPLNTLDNILKADPSIPRWVQHCRIQGT